ncbi:MAG: type IV pilus assembly protein PilM [SAR92 clade bacterium]|uniref:Type IV pilus assembly protein PilM n=1 Tax=SAR92 clade bacterium TaxID=2315479 RepID=A0A520MNZ3_9GAMM|nr:MAG: type IV pilus assembly protein PilM [SAR92 clade bacterium]
MKCIQLVNENPVILASRNDYYWVSFVFSKLFALKDKILSLNVGLKSVPKTILGIDISSSAIKLIEMESNHGGYKVVSYGVSPLPPGAVIDREIIDIEATAKVLKIVYQDSNASSLKAAVAVSGSSVISNFIDVPRALSEKQLEARVELEAGAIIPFNLDEVNLDFAVVGQNPLSKDELRVQVVACQRDYVDQRKEVIKLAGLQPVVVDVESFAFARAYKELIKTDAAESRQHDNTNSRSMGYDPEEVVAVIDIGASVFTFVVISQAMVVYSLEQPFGGKQLTEDIQRRYNLSWAEAGKAKRKGGLDSDYVETMLGPFKGLLIQHIKRSIQVFYSSTEIKKIDRLMLSGGVSKVVGLPDEISKAVDIPAEIVDLLKNITLSSQVSRSRLLSDTPAMMLAFGLALSKGHKW